MRGYFDKICRRARKFGLGLCSAEAGFQLCLQHADLFTTKERYLIGMKPVKDTVGDKMVFYMGRDAYGPWLSIIFNHLDDSHLGQVEWKGIKLFWIFALPETEIE